MADIIIKETRSGYKQFWLEGKRLPSPSAICSRYKDSGGLLYWANSEGLEGRTLEEARQTATTPGHLVHARIEAQIRGHDFDRDKWAAKIDAEGLDADVIYEKANAAWNAYRAWSKATSMKPIAAEVSLASKVHRYGGTLDAVTVTDGLYLADWKTGAVYPDHLLQLGGYIILWEENFPDKPLDGVMLLSISKEHGGFQHAQWPRASMQIAVDQFIALRECYERDRILKKMV